MTLPLDPIHDGVYAMTTPEKRQGLMDLVHVRLSHIGHLRLQRLLLCHSQTLRIVVPPVDLILLFGRFPIQLSIQDFVMGACVCLHDFRMVYDIARR